jgi:hypothetical protein
MTIENKELYNLFKSVKIDYDNGIYGLYIEGFTGGINAYATDGRAVFRKTFFGDNNEAFTAYYKNWQKKDGKTDNFRTEETGSELVFKEMKAYFENERFNSFTVDAQEFKKAVRGVDVINRGERERNIVLSLHNGKLDIAGWTGIGDTASWQLDGDYSGNGAVCITKKYLDGVKGKTLEFSYSKLNGNIVLHIHGDIEAVIMPKKIDPAVFLEVLEYEYNAPEKPEIKIEPEPVIVEPARKPVKRLRAPRVRKENGAFTGWTYNRLGTKQTKVCNW